MLAHHYALDVAPVGRMDAVLFAAAQGGWAGVDLFFVLSGFLITGILLQAKGSPRSLRAFYARRALRILPAHSLLLAVCFGAGPLFGLWLVGPSQQHAAWFWLFGGNLLIALHGWPDRVLAHLWSLAIEEHFYLAWPLVVLALSRRGLLAASVLLALGSAALRGWVVARGWDSAAAYVFTLTRLDGLAVGAALAAVVPVEGGPGRRLARAGAAAGCVLALVAAAAVGLRRAHWGTWGGGTLAWGLLALALGLGGALAWLLSLDAGHAVRRGLRVRPLCAVGRVSYGLYLFHMLPVSAARHLDLHPSALAPADSAHWPYVAAYAAVQFTLAGLMAAASWVFLEAPCLRLKARWPYR